MNYTTFKTQILQLLQKHLQPDTDIHIEPIIKNNGIMLDGLVIQENSVNISPTLYLNYYYEDYINGDSMEQVTAHILSDYKQHKSAQNIELSFFTQYDRIKYNIIFKVINYNSNQALLKKAPHFRFLDLAIVFSCLLLDTPKGNATILILNSHMEYWKVSKEQLYAAAKINTPLLLPFEIQPLDKLLNKMIPDWASPEDSQAPNLYVLSNQSNLYGASAILYTEYISEFSRDIGYDCYILPRSIHELLLMPAEKHISPRDLTQMICQVNESHVLEEEVLSDHPYYFSMETGEITQL